MPQVQARDHGRYVIKGGYLNNRALARAFVRQARQIKGSILECSADTVEAAMDQVASELDRIAMEAAAARRTDPASGILVPTQAEYETALRCLAILTRVMDLLHTHAISPNWLPSFAEVARFGGFTDLAEVELAYDRIAGAVAQELGMSVASEFWRHLMLAFPDKGSRLQDVNVELQPELRSALIALLGAKSALQDQGELAGSL